MGHWIFATRHNKDWVMWHLIFKVLKLMVKLDEYYKNHFFPFNVPPCVLDTKILTNRLYLS